MANERKYCRKCGTPAAKDAKFCENCGYAFSVEAKQTVPKLKVCQSCGRENAAGARFCRYCGAGLSGKRLAGANAMAQRSNIETPSAGRQNMHAAQLPGGFGGFANGLRAPADPGEIALDIPELYEAPSLAGSRGLPGFLKLPVSLAAGGISFPLLSHFDIPWSLLAGAAVFVVTIILSSVIKKSRGGGK